MEFEELEKQREEGRKVAEQGRPVTKQGAMTLRERFQRAMHYQHVDRLPNFEFGYWAETFGRWYSQGLPKSVVSEATAYEYFGIENYFVAPVNVGLKAAPRGRVIAETEETVTYRDGWGGVSETNKRGEKSIPHYLEYPIKDRKSWQRFKEMLEDDSRRYPENWDDLVGKYRRRDYPLGINFGSLLGIPRNLIGFVNIALMVCEDPALLEEIVESFCACSLRSMERALQDVQFDFAAGWEDICFNSGPIVGVNFFRDVATPRYKRLTDLLHLHGVDIAYTDCDGNMNLVLPYLMEGGVNTLFPLEINPGNDAAAMRKKFGKNLRVWGGVDKMIFLRDKKAVDEELERLRPIVEEGGVIPTVDHRVQADARLDLYKHYLDRKREWFNVGGEPKY